MKNLFGEINIEDLWINYFSVGSNITRAKLEIFNMGPLWFAPCVSANIPIVQPAKIKDGDLIVDGALLNDMPIDIMAKFIGPVLTDTLPDSVKGTIIAENISPPEDMLNVYDYGYHISGLKILLNKINPFSEKINLPSLIEMLMRTNELSSISQRKDLLAKNYAKYYLEPPVGEIGLMEVKKLSEAFEIGYKYSLNQIKKWDL